jgi:proteasome lid subunit RPN8/RPN11
LTLPRAFADEIIQHAREENPAEACGLIAGQAGQAVKLYRIPNADPSIYRYNMEPLAQLRAMQDMDDQGWDLLAIYHSHTHTPAYPSPTDISLAFYPDAYYAIVTLQDAKNPAIRAFRIVGGVVSEVEVHFLPPT